MYICDFQSRMYVIGVLVLIFEEQNNQILDMHLI